VNNYPPKLLVAPCDGKIISISRINQRMIHIAIFIHLWDAHVQWCPINGIVESIVHKEGSFHPAYMLNKSKYNERIETVLYIPAIDDYIKIVQIAGQIARRIVMYKEEDDEVERGDIIGFIKLGSRVDLFVPHDKVKLLINIGDTVIGNKTIIGSLRS
jgi:phosphatidylserine decarboxylase